MRPQKGKTINNKYYSELTDRFKNDLKQETTAFCLEESKKNVHLHQGKGAHVRSS